MTRYGCRDFETALSVSRPLLETRQSDLEQLVDRGMTRTISLPRPWCDILPKYVDGFSPSQTQRCTIGSNALNSTSIETQVFHSSVNSGIRKCCSSLETKEPKMKRANVDTGDAEEGYGRLKHSEPRSLSSIWRPLWG